MFVPLGSAFAYHPEFTNATMVVAEAHPSTAGLPERWNVTDEIYNFDRDPRITVGAVVVLTADESTYNDPGARETGQGEPHPICRSPYIVISTIFSFYFEQPGIKRATREQIRHLLVEVGILD